MEQRIQAEKTRLALTATRLTALFTVVKTQGEARLQTLLQRIQHAARQNMESAQYRLDLLQTSLQPLVQRKLSDECHRLDLLEQRTKALDPQLLLQRGYSITLHNGKALTDTDALHEGDVVETRLAAGSFTSTVKTKS